MGCESHTQNATLEISKTEQGALLCRSICASCMHAVLHLGISNYLHKCVIKAEWEMERLIDLTWVTQWERNQTENYIWQLELRLSMKAWVLCCIRFVIRTEGELRVTLQPFLKEVTFTTFPKVGFKVQETHTEVKCGIFFSWGEIRGVQGKWKSGNEGKVS